MDQIIKTDMVQFKERKVSFDPSITMSEAEVKRNQQLEALKLKKFNDKQESDKKDLESRLD